MGHNTLDVYSTINVQVFFTTVIQYTTAGHENSNTVYRTIVFRGNLVKNLHVDKKQTFGIDDLLQSPTFEERSQHLGRDAHATHKYNVKVNVVSYVKVKHTPWR